MRTCACMRELMLDGGERERGRFQCRCDASCKPAQAGLGCCAARGFRAKQGSCCALYRRRLFETLQPSLPRRSIRWLIFVGPKGLRQTTTTKWMCTNLNVELRSRTGFLFSASHGFVFFLRGDCRASGSAEMGRRWVPERLISTAELCSSVRRPARAARCCAESCSLMPVVVGAVVSVGCFEGVVMTVIRACLLS